MYKKDSFFTKNLLNWYETDHRSLPWRETSDPYKIWLSEIILQQTRVNQGLPYYQRFVESFPTVQDLAKAEEKEVLRLWQGLGYYSRARNLHACAQAVVNNYQGKFPTTYLELQKLKGVGRYTAAAIASLAFKETVPVVDGNVMRLLSRYFGVEDDILQNTSWNKFFALAQEQMDLKQPDIYNQALMEFGAIQCKPASPNCIDCVLKSKCFAFKNGLQQKLPVKAKKAKGQHVYMYYLVLQQEQKLFLKERQGAGIWKGLYDFTLIESKEPRELEEVVQGFMADLQGMGEVMTMSEEIKHLLTHRQLHVRFIHIIVPKSTKVSVLAKSYSLTEVAALPKPIVIHNYLEEHFF